MSLSKNGMVTEHKQILVNANLLHKYTSVLLFDNITLSLVSLWTEWKQEL